MSRKVSLYILLGTVALIGALFYRVIQPFIYSLLLAAVLAVLFGPVHAWVTRKCYHRRRMAAGLTTVAIVLAIFLPLAGALMVAGAQLFALSQEVVQLLESPGESALSGKVKKLQQSRLAQTVTDYYGRLSADQKTTFQQLAAKGVNGLAKRVYEKTVGLVGDIVQFLIGSLVMVLALYYFLADGDAILSELRSLSPLGEEEKNALIEQFGRVCRGVIVGSVVAGLVQAILAGIGYAVVGVPNVLLLTTVTMGFSFIPFLGAGSVLTCISLWLVLEQQYAAAIGLLIYGLILVGTADNLIKAYLIGTEVKMNPLVALMTVVGALQLIGLWGIFVGPMIAAFFYALLKILRERLKTDAGGMNVNSITTAEG